jgi:hypothetical protein
MLAHTPGQDNNTHRLRFKVVSGIQVNRWFKPGSLPQGWWQKLHVVKNYDGKIQLTLNHY